MRIHFKAIQFEDLLLRVASKYDLIFILVPAHCGLTVIDEFDALTKIGAKAKSTKDRIRISNRSVEQGNKKQHKKSSQGTPQLKLRNFC